MLIGDADALSVIDLADFLEDIDLKFLHAANLEQLTRIDGAFGDLATVFDLIAFLDAEVSTVIGLVFLLFKVIGDDNYVSFVYLSDVLDGAGDLRDAGFALRISRFDKLLDTGKTGRDVATSHTTSVEDSHGELSTRFADGLGGHDADRVANIDEIAGSHVLTIAVLADAVFGFAGEDGADLNLFNAAGYDGFGLIIADHGVAFDDDLTGLRIDDVVHRIAARDTVIEGLDDFVLSGVADFTNHEAMVAVAVLFADDDVLRDVDETTGEVARVRGLKRGIRGAFTGAVGVVEVFGDL